MKNSNTKPPIRKNDDITIKIDSITSQGYGIGRIDGFAIFVPDVLAGERISAHIIKVKSSYGVAKLLNIQEPSPDRVDPQCPTYALCGGCNLKHLKYEEQLNVKYAQIKDAMERIGGFQDINILSPIGMDDPIRYRNKGSFPYAFVNGRSEVGFYTQNTHRLVPVDDCAIQNTKITDVAIAVRDWSNKYSIMPYDEETHEGVLRHVVARTTTKGEVMAVVVTAGALPRSQELVDMLRNAMPSIVSIIHNINNADTNVILGNRYDIIWGNDCIMENILGMEFKVSAASFLQVNPLQTVRLYELVLEYLDLNGTETVADVYCGIGTISLLIARKAKQVVGIESVKEAVSDARFNSSQNGITNADFVCADAEEALPRMVEAGMHPDAIVLDPPRKGCDEKAIEAIIDSKAPKLVYVSCNPATLARDCRILCDNGYNIKKVQPIDMFPHSAHVETIVLMQREDEN